MVNYQYTIGQVSRHSGIPVRRIRFYCDEGLLPRIDRSESGYRLFDDEDLTTLVMIQVLRDADLSLDAIRSVINKQKSINDVLDIRLHEIEASIAAQKRIATTIRVALRSSNPTSEDLRRIWLMSNISKAGYVSSIHDFLNKVSEGSNVNSSWGNKILKSSTFNLPEDPSGDQVDAWMELQQLMNDQNFIINVRKYAEDSRDNQQSIMMDELIEKIIPKVLEVRKNGLGETTQEAKAIADEYISLWANAYGVELDEVEIKRQSRMQHEHRKVMQPYWNLICKLNGKPDALKLKPEWQWLTDAYIARLAELT